MPYCSSCGAKLNREDRFCHECGKPVNNVVQNQNSGRNEEYVGKVFKCPSCGGIITESTIVCPECGFEITGRDAVSSVKDFEKQLMEIESKRKGGIFNVLTKSSDIVDNRKLNLIRNYPIPNTIDDIKEFIFLAIANIDVKLSKQSIGSKFSNAMNSNDKNRQMQKQLSDAWVAKMQQAYQKAQVSFSDHPVFQSIQTVYFEKLKELKMK